MIEHPVVFLADCHQDSTRTYCRLPSTERGTEIELWVPYLGHKRWVVVGVVDEEVYLQPTSCSTPSRQ